MKKDNQMQTGPPTPGYTSSLRLAGFSQLLRTDSTTSSNVGVEDAIRAQIIVSCTIETRVKPKATNASSQELDSYSFHITFKVDPTQRPDTLLKGQGDHVTSYTAIIEAILSSVKKDTLTRAREITKEFGVNVLLGTEAKDKIAAMKPPTVHRPHTREKIINSLRNSEYEQEELNTINWELQFAKISSRAQELCILASTIIIEAQKLKHTTYYHTGRTNKKTNEGTLAKNAARALISLDRLVQIDNQTDSKKKDSALNDLKKSMSTKKQGRSEREHIVRFGISVWHGQLQEGKEAADKFEQAIAKDAPKAVQDKINELIMQHKQIAQYIGDLFDYHHALEFSITPENKAFDINLSKDNNKASIEDKVHKYFLEEKHRISIKIHKKNKKTTSVSITVNRLSAEDLVIVIANHMKVINAAYPALRQQLKILGAYEKVIKYFIEDAVLKQQGWVHEDFLEKSPDTSQCDYLISKPEIKALIDSASIEQAASSPPSKVSTPPTPRAK